MHYYIAENGGQGIPCELISIHREKVRGPRGLPSVKSYAVILIDGQEHRVNEYSVYDAGRYREYSDRRVKEIISGWHYFEKQRRKWNIW